MIPTRQDALVNNLLLTFVASYNFQALQGIQFQWRKYEASQYNYEVAWWQWHMANIDAIIDSFEVSRKMSLF